MQITALNVGIKDKERVNVFVDGSFKMAVDQNTIAQEHLFVGKDIDDNLIAKLKDVDTFNYISRKIISWVYARPRSSREISDKIKKILSNRTSSSINYNVNFSELLNYILEKLSNLGIDNSTYGKWLIENRFHQGKYGKQRVYSELVSKGLNSSSAKQLLNEHFPEEENVTEKLLQKKFNVSSVKEIKDPKLRSRAYRYLISKGFKIL